MNEHQEHKPNGHSTGAVADYSAAEGGTVWELPPIAPMPTPRRGWWQAMTRPLRAIADSSQGRSDSAVLLRWMPLVTFLILQGGLAIYAFGHLNAVVEQHDKTLSAAGISELLASNKELSRRLEDLNDKYKKQQEYIDVIGLYEQKIRELMVSTGRFRSSELPPPPQRPRE